MLDHERTSREIAGSIVYREARHLDRGEWSAWLTMYSEGALYWVPAWLDEYSQTDNPKKQLSLMYHNGRRGLEERVARIGSRKSVTALPLPRTVHQVSNIEILDESDGVISAESVFSVHVYDPRLAKEHVRHGRYNHVLERHGQIWFIVSKVVKLVNDRVPTVLDFYSV